MQDLADYINARDSASKPRAGRRKSATVIALPEVSPMESEKDAELAIAEETLPAREAVRGRVRDAIRNAVEIDDLQHPEHEPILRDAIKHDMRLALAWRQMIVAAQAIEHHGGTPRIIDSPKPSKLATMKPMAKALSWRQYVVAVESIRAIVGA